MVRDDELTEDIVISIVQNIIMKTGIVTYTRVRELLAEQNITFADCYRKPDVLKSVMKEAFGDAYLDVVEQFKAEFRGFEKDNSQVSSFLQKLSE